jgi:hypothetical protein
LDKIHAALAATERESARQRDLPGHVTVYYVIALALYMQSSYREVLRCLLEGIQWLARPSASLNVAGNSGISQARTRLGWEPLRHLHDQVVKPIAVAATKGAWYRSWRLVSMDGSTLDIADEKGNDEAFGRPGASRGQSAYPQIRFVSLVENGTHVLFGSRMADYATSEIALAKTILPSLSKGMLCLADRGFFGFEMWKQAAATGADLLWRVRKNILLPCEKRLPDGSYLSRIYPSQQDQRRGCNGVVVRVIESGWKESKGLSRCIGWQPRPSTTNQHQPRNWRRFITTAGRSKLRSTNSRLICGVHGSCCAARHRIWYGRNSTVC